MIIGNAKIYGNDNTFHMGELHIASDKITDIIYYDYDMGNVTSHKEDYIDAKGQYVIPGLIDMHLHGAVGYDIGDASPEAIDAISKYELSQGITSFAGATMTMPTDNLISIIRNAASYISDSSSTSTVSYNHSNFCGLNMEGPFISKEKCGAQNPDHIKKPNLSLAQEFINEGSGVIKILGIAPECGPYEDFIEELSQDITIALTHSNSNYDIACSAINKGANHITHLFNGMSNFSHREPGILGAVVDNDNVTCELICDGIHLHPATIRMVYNLIGPDRLIIISDSMRATGLGDGIYQLGDLNVSVSGDRATIPGTNNPAGSVCTLSHNVRYAYNMGIPLEDVVKMSTINPAKKLDIYDKVGSLDIGKQADIIMLDSNISVNSVIKSGIIYQG